MDVAFAEVAVLKFTKYYTLKDSILADLKNLVWR